MKDSFGAHVRDMVCEHGDIWFCYMPEEYRLKEIDSFMGVDRFAALKETLNAAVWMRTGSVVKMIASRELWRMEHEDER